MIPSEINFSVPFFIPQRKQRRPAQFKVIQCGCNLMIDDIVLKRLHRGAYVIGLRHFGRKLSFLAHFIIRGRVLVSFSMCYFYVSVGM
jgi:hypothetical protein